MTSKTPTTTVVTSIVVEAPVERAFKVFTEDFGRFKPPDQNLLGVDVVETVFEPWVGGHLYDRGVDGSECRWARVPACSAAKCRPMQWRRSAGLAPLPLRGWWT